MLNLGKYSTATFKCKTHLMLNWDVVNRIRRKLHSFGSGSKKNQQKWENLDQIHLKLQYIATAIINNSIITMAQMT